MKCSSQSLRSARVELISWAVVIRSRKFYVSTTREVAGVLAVIYRVQKTSARLELMFFLSLMTWVQIVESPMYPSDSFLDCVQAFEKAMTL